MKWTEDKIRLLIGPKATCTFGSRRNISAEWRLSRTCKQETATSTVSASQRKKVQFYFSTFVHPSVAQCGNQEAHFVAAAGLRLSWSLFGLPLAYRPDSGSSHVKLSLVIVISHCEAWPPWLLSKFTVRAVSEQHPSHNYTPTPPARWNKFDCDPRRSTPPNGSRPGCLLIPIIWSRLAEASMRK